MIDRTEKAFGVKPERLPADTAFTPGHALVNSTPARTSPIVASLRDASPSKPPPEVLNFRPRCSRRRDNAAGYGGSFRVFKGIESDILLDAALDYPDEVLQRFDFVVASVHSRFRLDRKTQTERIIRAVENPYTTILGHMTGRQLLRRPGYEVDIEEILAACATHGVAVEINANPWRLDLDWRWHERALERGCMMSINPDAHSTDEVDLTHWGVVMARKGGVPKERVLNCLDLPRFAAFLAERLRPVDGSLVIVVSANARPLAKARTEADRARVLT